MRRTIFFFAFATSLLMLAWAAADGSTNTHNTAQTATTSVKSVNGTIDDLKDTVMGFKTPFLQSEIVKNFNLSSVLGLFDSAVIDMNIFGRCIDKLQEQSLKERKELESIRAWAQASAGNAKQSKELTQQLSFLKTKQETGENKIKELKHHKEIVEKSIKEADTVIQEFDKRQAELVKMVVDVLTTKGLPTVDSIIDLVKQAVPVAMNMYLQIKEVNRVSTRAEEAFEAAKQSIKSIKQYIKESQEIEKSLQTSELKHAAPRKIVVPDGAIISDVSFGFSLLQDAVFLTLVGAFLSADKSVW